MNEMSPIPTGLDRSAAARRIVARLSPHLAAGRMMTDPLMTYAWSGDASAWRLIPALVVIVDSEDEVRLVLKASRAEGLPVTFRAAGTSLSGQAVTEGVLCVLGDGFRTIALSPDGMRATFGPAIIVANANKALKRFNRKLGPDPASQATCKIGGVVANNSSGMCCGVVQNTYHTMHRLRVMLADGTVLDSGDPASVAAFRASHAALLETLHDLHREVTADADLVALIRRKYAIKNTVGYSLNALVDFHDPIDILIHLMVGSEGTLGFVSEVTYDTVPDHPFKATALVPFPDAHSCARGIMKAESSGVSAAEYMERRALATVEDKPVMAPLLPVLTGTSPAVLVEVMAPDAEGLARAIASATAALMSEHPLMAPVFTLDPDAQNALWDIRKGMFTSGGATRPPGTSFLTEDVAAPIDRLADFVLAMRDLLDAHGYEEAIIFGHALAGNLHFVMSADFSDPEAAGRFDRFNHELCDLVSVRFGGSLKAEHGTGRAIAAFVEQEWGPRAYELMQAIKLAFDPEGLLNPGVLINPDPQIHIKDLKLMPVTTALGSEPLVDLCIECGFCEPACPSHQLTLSPRQRIAVTRERARLTASGEDPDLLATLTDDFGYAGLDTCAACNLCSLRCPVGIETGTMVLGQRAQRRTERAEGVAHFVAQHTGAVETAMRLGVGTQTLARKLVGNGVVDAVAGAARSLSGERIPRVSRTLTPGRAPLPFPQVPTASRGQVVYFPACPTRMFGAPDVVDIPGQGPLNLLPTADAMVELLKRAGYDPIVPRDLNGQCCGQPFESKGFPAEAERLGASLDATLTADSRHGALPVLTDASTCAKHMRGHGESRVADSPEFLLAEVLPYLTIAAPLPVVAVHHNCSAQRLGGQRAIEALAAAMAGRIAVLNSVTCCGYAGDKGLFQPELNAHATRFVRNDIPEDCGVGISTVSTCASGLSERAGVPFVSLASLLEAVSR